MPTTPYATVTQVQATIVQPNQKKKDTKEVNIVEEKTSAIKSKRVKKVKQELESPSKKRTKQFSSGPGKRRKTLQMIELGGSKEEEEIEKKPIEKMTIEVKTTSGKKP